MAKQSPDVAASAGSAKELKGVSSAMPLRGSHLEMLHLDLLGHGSCQRVGDCMGEQAALNEVLLNSDSIE